MFLENCWISPKYFHKINAPMNLFLRVYTIKKKNLEFLLKAHKYQNFEFQHFHFFVGKWGSDLDFFLICVFF